MVPDGGISDLLPALDVRERDDAYVIDLDLPGIDPDQTEVLVEGRTVTIRGRVEEESEEERGNYLVRERRQGAFLRAVALPGMIDVDKVSTRYEDGQLTIVLPKASASRARRIAIGNGNGNGRRGSRASDEQSGNRSRSATGSPGARPSSSQKASSGNQASSAQGGSSTGSSSRTSQISGSGQAGTGSSSSGSQAKGG
jgi:HSP20 family protein